MAGLKGESRETRILTVKLGLLYRGHIAIPVNMAVALMVAFQLRDSFPMAVLLGWLGATASVGTGRLWLHRRYMQASHGALDTAYWARAFTLGTLASGLLWATLCAGLTAWGTIKAYVLLTFVAGGMAAGALATFSPYMPAYLAFTAPFLLSLAFASVVHPNSVIKDNGILTLLYFIVLTGTCRFSSRFVARTVKLQVDNEILRSHLRTTRRERDHARTDKWSTLAQLSHELRTPLNAIMGFSEAMLHEVLGALGNRRYKDYANHIHVSGQRLLRLTDELMLISQGEAGALALREESVDLHALITALVVHKSETAEKAGLRLVMRLPSDLPQLYADKAKLRQMLRHLLENAIKFTPAGGRVCLAGGVATDGAIELTVTDTGIGIEAEDIPRALRPFGRVATPLTACASGPGLGLPIAARLAELHGARLAITSTPGEGTRIAIVFPLGRTRKIVQANAA